MLYKYWYKQNEMSKKRKDFEQIFKITAEKNLVDVAPIYISLVVIQRNFLIFYSTSSLEKWIKKILHSNKFSIGNELLKNCFIKKKLNNKRTQEYHWNRKEKFKNIFMDNINISCVSKIFNCRSEKNKKLYWLDFKL